MYKLIRNKDGNFAIITAIAAPILLVLMGLAIDATSSYSMKADMQDRLDAALLVAIQSESSSDQKKAAKKYLKASLPGSKLKDFSSSNQSGVREISARLKYKNPLMFGEILGQDKAEINVRTTVRAPMVLSSMRIKLDRAAGWFSKVASIKGINSSGHLTTIAEAAYTYTHGYGSTFDLTDDGWIDVRDYSNIYIEFKIDPNSFGFPANCWLSGCPGTDFSTNQTEYSDRFFFDGVQLAPNTTIDFVDTLKCGQIIKHAWEDGGGHGPDFEYEVEARCDAVNPGDVYVSN